MRPLLTRLPSLRAALFMLGMPILSSALFGTHLGSASSLAVSSQALTATDVAHTVPVETCTLTATADTYSDESNAATNFGGAADLIVESASAANRRTFVSFDIGSCVPANADVQSATLTLFLSTAPSASRTHEMRRVTAAWTETGLTWSAEPTVNGTATASLASGTTSGVGLDWNVASDAQAMVDGTVTNYGWRLADATEGAAPAQQAIYGAREHPTAAQRPKLVIEYYD